ncbi:Ger(x)C family spore germination protein [Paenibacillus sp. TAB 01]|uniref:Ger(x)C family spore germination protein n=1 Tax=Paenibacillus sp. TAB 01 TaxID=3368988 RepID=UPI00375133A1
MVKTVCMILLASMALSITGCWNGRELNNIALVVGMGIDKSTDSHKYRLTFQIIIPGNVAQGSKGTGSGLEIVVYSEEDATLFGALRKTSQKVPRQLFFAHIQQLVIGEPLAQEGIGDLFDFFERSHELRMNSPVLIARGTSAESILRVILPLEKNPSSGLAKRLELTNKVWAQNVDVNVKDILKELLGQGEAAISGVQIVGDPNKGETKANLEHSKLPAYFKIEGVALFKNKKLIKWLDGEESRGTLWLQDKMKGAVLDIPCKNKKEGTSIELIRSNTKIRVDMEDGHPIIRIGIDEEGIVNEVHCPIDLSKRKEIIELQKQWAKLTEKEIMLAVKAAQQKKSDIFGFGEEVERTHPKLWKDVKEQWPEIFAESKMEVQVKAFLRRTGMRSKPYFMQ